MEIKSYIFLTSEGTTFAPYEYSKENKYPNECYNLQVIGFAEGENANDAFKKLISESEYIKEYGFKDIFSYPLEKRNYIESIERHFA